jgi:hypothetical protein
MPPLTSWDMRVMLANSLEDIDYPDFLAFNKDGQIVLIAEVKGFPYNFQDTKAKNYATLRLIDYLHNAQILIPFAMLVDVNTILIFKWDSNNLSEPIITLNTADVLIDYDPNFLDKKIFSFYIKGLLEAWVRDLAYNWKSEIPPFTNEMAAIGLLQLLKNGKTQIY